MSTYNGELYIREQLDSILNQNHVDVQLCIRDDGSSDNTISILSEYKQNYPKKIEVLNGENIGWKESFFGLLQYAAFHHNTAEYFAFADQDDIWLPEKLAIAIQKIGETNRPTLYCGNQFYYKDGKNYGIVREAEVYSTYKNCLVRNYATGCTIVFNKALLSLLARGKPNLDVAHDYWLYQVATLCGKVIIDRDAHILYRQHENNQIGAKAGKFKIWKRRIHDFKGSLKDHQRERQSQELLRLYADVMNEDAKIATNIAAYYRKKLIYKLKFLFDSEYTMDSSSNDFWLKLRILFNAF